MGSTPTRPNTKKIHVVLDFDGTVSVDDVGDLLFKTFGQFEPIHSELLEGKISVAEYYRQSVQLLNDTCTPEKLLEWAIDCEVDPGFVDLVKLCRDREASVSIVSDGFDVYIKPIIEKAGVGLVEVSCNRLSWNKGWTPQFPGATESCSCFCASCKRNEVIGKVADGDVLVYVGDGMSDRCAAEHSDIVFAKDSLAAYCTEKRIPHHPFKTLHDVQRMMSTRFARKDFPRRRQALLARQAAFISE